MILNYRLTKFAMCLAEDKSSIDYTENVPKLLSTLEKSLMFVIYCYLPRFCQFQKVSMVFLRFISEVGLYYISTRGLANDRFCSVTVLYAPTISLQDMNVRANLTTSVLSSEQQR